MKAALAAEAEAVGFSGDRLFLMPVGHIGGLTPNARGLPATSAHAQGPHELTPTGLLPSFLPRLWEHGVQLPGSVMDAASAQEARGAPP